jgi:hypothetical protein
MRLLTERLCNLPTLRLSSDKPSTSSAMLLGAPDIDNNDQSATSWGGSSPSSARAMNSRFSAVSDPCAAKLAALAHWKVRASAATLREALHGRIKRHHRFLLRVHLQQIDALDAAIAEIDRDVEPRLTCFRDAVKQLSTIPGVSELSAQAILSEIGIDLGRRAHQSQNAQFVRLRGRYGPKKPSAPLPPPASRAPITSSKRALSMKISEPLTSNASPSPSPRRIGLFRRTQDRGGHLE